MLIKSIFLNDKLNYLFKYLLCIFVCCLLLGCDLTSHSDSQINIVETTHQPSQKLNPQHVNPSRDEFFSHRNPQIKQLISQALECDITQLTQCKAWILLSTRYAHDLRQVIIDAPDTNRYVLFWFSQSSALLKSSIIHEQILGFELLLMGVKRLKYRSIPKRKELTLLTHELITQELDPLHQSRLLHLLDELTPLQDGSPFIQFTESTQPTEVQEQAWRILAKRHSQREPILLTHVKRSVSKSTPIAVKASIINAASLIKTPLLVRWCGSRWWQTKLYKDCKIALTRLGTKNATLSLWRWIDSLFSEIDHTLNSDQVIAEALVHLSYGEFTPRLKRRYLKLLDRFFGRRRSEQAALTVAYSWLQLKSKRFAREVILRYLKPKQIKIASQSYVFNQQLKDLLHILGSEF